MSVVNREENNPQILLELQGIPVNHRNPFLVFTIPLLFLLFVVSFTDYIPGAGDAAQHFISTIRKNIGRLMMAQDGTLISKDFVPIAIIIAIVMSLVGVQAIFSMYLGFRLPLPTWGSLDLVSKVALVWLHFSMLTTVAGVMMFVLPYFYTYFVRLRRFKRTVIESNIDIDEALNILSPFENVEELLTSLAPLPAQTRKRPAQIIRRMFFRMTRTTEQIAEERLVPTTFESWREADDTYRPSIDPLRLFVVFFHPIILKERAALTVLKRQIGQLTNVTDANGVVVPLMDEETMLKKIYHLHELVNGTRNGAVNHEQGLQDIQLAKHELLPHLHVVWKAMQIELHFRHTDDNDPLAEAIIACPEWGSFAIAVLLMFSQLMEYVGLNPSCPDLSGDDGIFQNLSWYYQQNQRDPFSYPNIPNARKWDCTANMCYLECNRGYVSSNGQTECDALGGAGVAWTHLCSDTLNVAACCIASDSAETLNEVSLTRSDFSFTTNQTFSIGCGANQTLTLQLCLDQSTKQWQQRSTCQSACEIDDSGKVADETVCTAVPVEGIFPVLEWNNMLAMETVNSTESDRLAITYSTSDAFPVTIPDTFVSGMLYRLVYDRPVGKVLSGWKKWSPTATLS